MPSGTVGLYSRMTCAASPAACSLESASASGRPTTSGSPTFGAAAAAGPSDTIMTAVA